MKNIYTFNVLGVCVHVHHPFASYITHGKYCVEETHNPVCCIHTSVIEYIQISLHNLQQNILPLQQLSTVAQKLLKISHQSFLFFIIIYFVKKDMKVSIQLFLSSHDWRERKEGRTIREGRERVRVGVTQVMVADAHCVGVYLQQAGKGQGCGSGTRCLIRQSFIVLTSLALPDIYPPTPQSLLELYELANQE